MKERNTGDLIAKATIAGIGVIVASVLAIGAPAVLGTQDTAYAATKTAQGTSSATAIKQAKTALDIAIAKAMDANKALSQAKEALLRAKQEQARKEQELSTREHIQQRQATELKRSIANAATLARGTADDSAAQADAKKAEYDALAATLPAGALSPDDLAPIYEERAPLQKLLDSDIEEKAFCEGVLALCEEELAGYAGDASKAEVAASCQATMDQARKDIAMLDARIAETRAALAPTDAYDGQVRCEMARREHEKAMSRAAEHERNAAYLEGLDAEAVAREGQVVDCGTQGWGTLKEKSTLNKEYVAEVAKARAALDEAVAGVRDKEKALASAENACNKALSAQKAAQKAYDDAKAKEKKKTSILGAKLAKKSFTYTGKAMTSKLVVKMGTKTLKKGRDYTVSKVTGCKKVGTHKVKITGIGGYKGYKIVSFKISKKK